VNRFAPMGAPARRNTAPRREPCPCSAYRVHPRAMLTGSARQQELLKGPRGRSRPPRPDSGGRKKLYQRRRRPRCSGARRASTSPCARQRLARTVPAISGNQPSTACQPYQQHPAAVPAALAQVRRAAGAGSLKCWRLHRAADARPPSCKSGLVDLLACAARSAARLHPLAGTT
jgi:hypothetical protein